MIARLEADTTPQAVATRLTGSDHLQKVTSQVVTSSATHTQHIRGLQLDNSPLQSLSNGLGAMVHIQLLKDIGDVRLYGALADG